LDDDLRQLTHESPLLARMPADAVAQLLEGAVRVEFPAGTCASRQEEIAAFGILASGLTRISLRGADGRSVTQRYLRRGDVGGIVAIFAGHAAGQCHALVDSVTYRLSSRIWRETAQSDARVAYALLEEVSRIASTSFQYLASEYLATTRQRVVRELLDIASERQTGAELVAPLTQQQIADGIGSAREVVARILRGLREERLVRTGLRGVVLLDPMRLQSELAPA
jgi:CRP/FNR family transcriptional regulator